MKRSSMRSRRTFEVNTMILTLKMWDWAKKKCFSVFLESGGFLAQNTASDRQKYCTF